MNPINVGLVGAGPHAIGFHAPMWAAGPQTRLAAWWAGRRRVDEQTATEHGALAVGSYQELLEIVDAVAFAMPPAVQWTYAIEAARANKHLVLEKPIADTLAHARTLTDTVASSGVGSVVLFTGRFSGPVIAGITSARRLDILGARGAIVSGVLLDRGASPWRVASGALLDLGPHLIDLAIAVLGQPIRVSAHRTPAGWVDIQLDHVSGRRSDLTVTGHAPADAARFTMEYYGRDGVVELDVWRTWDLAALMANVRSTLVDAAQRRPVAVDVHAGLAVHEVLDAARRSIERGRPCHVGLDGSAER